MNKFGPSGSLKSANITLEHTMAVMPKISNEVFFELKYIFAIVLGIYGLAVWYDVGTAIRIVRDSAHLPPWVLWHTQTLLPVPDR